MKGMELRALVCVRDVYWVWKKWEEIGWWKVK